MSLLSVVSFCLNLLVQNALPAVVSIEVHGSTGSGFFITPEGDIVTTAHLIEEGQKIKVRHHDQELSAEIIAIDRAIDLALLHVEGNDFPYLNFENSDGLQVGETVISLADSVVLGTVQATHFNAAGLFPREDFIQIGGIFQQGSSGGPILNTQGKVVGINAAAGVKKTGEYTGESLAISSNLLLGSLLFRKGKT